MSFYIFQVLLLAVYITQSSLAFPRFINGRPRGGMLGAPRFDNSVKLPDAQWFTQRLDHFDDSNTNTWQQRYFCNDSFYTKEGGPVFLMIGGEGAASPVWMVKGMWMEYAVEFGALTFMLEHRFYGESHPTRCVSDIRWR